LLLLLRGLLLRRLLTLGKLTKARGVRRHVKTMRGTRAPLRLRQRPRQRQPRDRMPSFAQLAELPTAPPAVSARGRGTRARPSQAPRDPRRIGAAARAPHDIAGEEAPMPAPVRDIMLSVSNGAFCPSVDS
jgi:hypothetical protein